ncbi:MAG: polysaccharide biosynthesis protein [Thermodesulfobacteriota bacterium]
MLRPYLRNLLFNRWAAFAHDLLCIPLSILLAFWFVHNLSLDAGILRQSLPLIVLAVPVQGLFFRACGLYRGMWRFASLPDLVRILSAVSVGSMAMLLASFLSGVLAGIPAAVMLLYPLLLTITVSGSRFFYRWHKDRHAMPTRQAEVKRVLLVGAGRGGELLARDLLRRPEYQPVLFVDDDPAKQGREIQGIRVRGTLADIESLVGELDIRLVLLAIPSANRDLLKRIALLCAGLGVQCQTLPAIGSTRGDVVGVSELRPITLEDLLGREPVRLDSQAIANCITGRVVLVTGGGGSIGSELCRQIAALRPAMLVVFDHGEYNLYEIDLELRHRFPDLPLATVLGDIKDAKRVEWLFASFAPQVVFHAAAYKHVPMLEINPAEGVRNNVTGTRVLADAAHWHGVERFVLISTDKAVNPTSVMGTTKRIAELYCQNLALRSKTRFITTRFGNVLGSAGSVVPLFERQIREGGPVTVTHREITRYFMTIAEAVGLILQAGAMGKGGEVFVLDMGEPVAIRELARQMIRLSGFEPDRDIKIVYTGLRPGEKLFEEVFHEQENLCGTTHPKLQLAAGRRIDWEWLLEQLDLLERAAAARDMAAILAQLKIIVPEYDGDPAGEATAPRRRRQPVASLRLLGASRGQQGDEGGLQDALG